MKTNAFQFKSKSAFENLALTKWGSLYIVPILLSSQFNYNNKKHFQSIKLRHPLTNQAKDATFNSGARKTHKDTADNFLVTV
jgi:hypothetical protein